MKTTDMKLLYAKSGGRCALCKDPIILSKSDGAEFHVSEIAHIRGKGTKSLRHDPNISRADMDDISNLIILCSKCHTTIDGNDIDYTVEKLLRLKEKHEEWVQTQLAKETSECLDDGFQVDLVDCVHIEESGSLIHHIELNLSNKTVTTLRIDSISILDKEGNKMDFVSRGQTSAPEAKFEIRGNEEYPWNCFCISQPTLDTDLAELNLVIQRRGKLEFKKNIESMLVPRREFPSGIIITTFRL
jgi:hypothetical protein